MQRLVLDCVSGVYIAKYGHLTLVLTQDRDEAKRVGLLYTGSDVEPNWWIENTNVNYQNLPTILDTINQIQQKLGNMGVCEFCSINENKFSLSGFSI